jgi:hypothetical protein
MKPAPELIVLTLRLYEASARGDTAFLEQLVSRQAGVIAIGTDPVEWWDDRDTIVQLWATQIEEMGGRLPIVGGDPQAYREGSVGWVVDRARFVVPGGTEAPFRLTLIFHYEAGNWRLVHLHVSVGVPNVDAIGRELTVQRVRVR